MTEQTHTPTRGLSREIVQLMLEMNSLLRRYNISVSLTASNVYDQFIQVSETIEDDDIVALRGHLVAAFTRVLQEGGAAGADGSKLALENLPASITMPREIPEPVAGSPETMPSQPLPPAEPGESTADIAHGLASTTQTPGKSQNVFLRKLHKKNRLTCDQCQSTIVLTLEKMADLPVEMPCTCGNKIQVNADGRKFPRRAVNLLGHYVKPENGETGTIVIDNISFGGLRFHTKDDTHSIAHDDRLQLQFTLDDEAQSVVSKKISVRYVLWNTVGAQFIDTANFDQHLAAYLMR
jgi:PilZ domain